MIQVLVAGAAGRMGREVVSAVHAADGLEVAACVDPAACEVMPGAGQGDPYICEPSLAEAIKRSCPDVMVDFTRPDSVEENLRTALAAGVDCVVGTTGLSEERLAAILAAERQDPDTCLFFAPNFAVGAVLMMQFAERAARYMPHAEVIEMHHDAKLDAPSGTAVRTARMIAAAREGSPHAPGPETAVAGFEGARGAWGAENEGPAIHSVRLPGFVAHQEVVFGGLGQTLTIRHDSIDRKGFMPGVVLACREVGSRKGLIVGLEKLMG
ncbi:MAG: 4-hydroxy-tetrahydrodipicolinate reductase [Coriobacteriia bacterium]|nr:4-hydroxy-tetrahydrodipicolinate reductase [Coriobacteriia bacterium]